MRKRAVLQYRLFHGFSTLETSEDRAKGAPTWVNFNEANAVVKPIKTSVFEQEVMCGVGKELASLVLYNSEYSFRLKGNWLRRPNEIMKLYNGASNALEVQNSEIFTDTNLNPFVMLYAISVTHHIDAKNNSFEDEIHTLRACEYVAS